MKVRCINDYVWNPILNTYDETRKIKGVKKGRLYTVEHKINIEQPVGWFGVGLHYSFLENSGIYFHTRFSHPCPELLEQIQIL